MPHVQEKCTARAKAPCAPERAELVDLLLDSKPKKRSLDQAASVPVPAKWQAASFMAHKKNCSWGENSSEEV
jgi:hypothetical protein